MDEMENRPQRDKRGGARLKKSNRKGVWCALLGAVALLAAGFGAVCILADSSTEIFRGVTVLGQDLGEMSAAQAGELLDGAVEKSPEGAGIRFTADGDSAYLSFAQLGVSFEPEQSAQRAYRYCHGGGFFRSGWRYLCAMLGSRAEICPVCSYEQRTVEARAEQLARKLSRKAVAFSETVSADGIHITKQRDKRTVEAAAVLAAITDETRFRIAGQSVAVLPFAVTKTPEGDLAAVAQRYAAEACSAGYDAESESITPERAHAELDIAAVQALLEQTEGGKTVVVGTVTMPKVTAQELERVLFRDVLSSYTTRVGGEEGRHKNVQNTANKINGVVLNSGESLKYSELVMPFTAENGYFPAPGYLKGKTVDMLGGGACQASSTLYAAAIYANLEIVQRRNHGFASDYIGLGLDATVAEGGPEFEVRNNTDYPIRVEALFYTEKEKDYITVRLYGTKTDDTYVKLRTELLSTTPFEEEIIETDELAPGVREVEQTAYTGYEVKTYRQIYSGDGTLLSEALEAYSKYNARNRIVKVGKAAAEASAAETLPQETAAETLPQETSAEPLQPSYSDADEGAEPAEAPTENRQE